MLERVEFARRVDFAIILFLQTFQWLFFLKDIVVLPFFLVNSVKESDDVAYYYC